MCNQCSSFFVRITQLIDEHLYSGSAHPINRVLDNFLEDNQVNGCALGIVMNDEVVYLQGRENPNGGDFIGLGNPVPVASISKTLTAMGIFVLMEEGFLNLNDRIDFHLPIPYYGDIRIRDLLSHKSGIDNHWPEFLGLHPSYLWPAIPLPFPENEDDLEELSSLPHPGQHPRLAYYTYYRGISLSSSAAESGKYSNLNYMLLGAIIDKITNEFYYPGPKGYSEFLYQKVLSKAGLSTACLGAKWKDIHQLANGYNSDNSNVNWPNSLWGWEGPPGGWTMTIGDLTRLIVAINTDKVLHSYYREELMMTRQTDDSFFPYDYGFGRRNWYGMGIQLFDDDGLTGYMHHGDFYGYTSRITYFDSSNIGIALMFNKAEVDKTAIWDLSVRIKNEVLLGALMSIHFSMSHSEGQGSISSKLLKTHHGRFERIPQFVQLISKDNPEFDFTKFIEKTTGRKSKKMIALFNEGKIEEASKLAMSLIDEKQKKGKRKRIKLEFSDDMV